MNTHQIALAVTLALLGAFVCEAAPAYRSPFDLAFSPDGKTVAVSDRTAASVVLINTASAKIDRRVALAGEPTGVAWSSDGTRLYVAQYGASSVAEVDVKGASEGRRFQVGRYPMGVAVASKRKLLLAGNTATHTVSVVDLASGKERTRIAVPREPFFIAIAPDESVAAVGNLLPAGRATDFPHSAAVSLIDLNTLKKIGDVKLPAGSSSVRKLTIGPEGKWLYVVHNLGRTNLPTTQLERGWVNTNALTIIDMTSRQVYASLLLDHPMEGGANPWGVAVSKDNSRLYVSISGIHVIGDIDLTTLHQFLDGKLPANHRLSKHYGPGTESTWLKIKQDPKYRADLVNDLASLYGADLIKRIPVNGKNPRGLDVSPDGKTLATAAYYSGSVAIIDTATGKTRANVSLGSSKPDDARRGEMIFHDATYCFQHWLSCSTCHPHNGRVDALNWDILNDGIGNPKNTKSLLQAHLTPPMTWRGARPSMEVSVEKGFFFLMRVPEKGEVTSVQAYLRSLKPQPSPHLKPNGQLTESAVRGKVLFESEALECASCHKGALFNDGKPHNVGTRGELDKADRFDTPSLIEIYRTAPYLHDGSAASLRELLMNRNKDDMHGGTSHLKKEQIDDLIAYLLSL